MDHGRDASLATRYHAEHKLSSEALAPGTGRKCIASFLRKPELLKMSLAELQQAGITPAVLASSGVTWSQLCKAHGANALLDMGFEWKHLRACGITAEHACSLGLDALHIDANQLMESCPTVANIASMQLPLATLKSRGFTMERLLAMGLTAANMRRLSCDIDEWARTYDCDWSKLGFIDYTTAERHGWNRELLHANGVFGSSRPDVPPTRLSSAPLDFY